MSRGRISPGPEIFPLLNRLEEYLSGRGLESYVVGGFVRDMLLGRRSVDIDIAVPADAPGIAAGVAEAFSGKYVLLDETNRIARVIITGQDPGNVTVIDFSPFSGDIMEDLARRDFTIDAMAFPLNRTGPDFSAAEIIDPHHGRDDIEAGIVRAVTETVFSDDPARLLRAVRLAAELGFAIEERTETLIKKHSRLVSGVPGERTREELLRLLALPKAAGTLEYLDGLGLLTGIFPELEASRGVEQPKEHYWDVLEHSLATVRALEFILGEGEWDFTQGDILTTVPRLAEISGHLSWEVSAGSTRKSLLKLAALLHDIAKPDAKETDADGRVRFIGHDKAGAGIAASRLEQLRFSGKEVKTVETAVINHMRPMQMSQEGMPTDRAVYRYFRDTGDSGLDILFLNLADHLATRGPELDLTGWNEHIMLVEYVLKKHSEKENIVNPPRIVNGYDIMKSFGLSPGARIGEILEAVREAQASGELKDREEALSFIQRYIRAGAFPERKKDIN